MKKAVALPVDRITQQLGGNCHIMCNLAYLEIHFRNSTVKRHTGFSVYVFNDSSFIPPSYGAGLKIFTQNSSNCPSQVMNVKIDGEAKGVALVVSKDPPLNTTCVGYEPDFASIEICEVLVLGCQAGHFGKYCEFCDSKCAGGHCDEFNGSCTIGCCNSLLEPPNCNECVKGFYGPGCSQTCGKCTAGTYCNKHTGDCPDGCQDNWTGEKCDAL
ncbi:cell death abnormality protein 1-like [Saccostrea cucullata]|uniref:cell death abnormality protein 1-like n=1 Tax=Saccostrea cuccullata TaxID=36930 RepID=UPI002ED2826D